MVEYTKLQPETPVFPPAPGSSGYTTVTTQVVYEHKVAKYFFLNVGIKNIKFNNGMKPDLARIRRSKYKQKCIWIDKTIDTDSNKIPFGLYGPLPLPTSAV